MTTSTLVITWSACCPHAGGAALSSAARTDLKTVLGQTQLLYSRYCNEITIDGNEYSNAVFFKFRNCVPVTPWCVIPLFSVIFHYFSCSLGLKQTDCEGLSHSSSQTNKTNKPSERSREAHNFVCCSYRLKFFPLPADGGKTVVTPQSVT